MYHAYPPRQCSYAVGACLRLERPDPAACHLLACAGATAKEFAKQSCETVGKAARARDLLGPTFASAADSAYVLEGAVTLQPQTSPAECWLAGDALYDCFALGLKRDYGFCSCLGWG